MTFAWYGRLKKLKESPLLVAIFVSWMIALLEYAIQVSQRYEGQPTENHPGGDYVACLYSLFPVLY